MIWSAAAWPFLAGAVSVILFNRRVTPFEAIALILGPLAVIYYMNSLGQVIVTNDVEYLTAPISTATYNQAWTEKVECKHTEKTEHGKVKKHPFDKVKHKASWVAQDTTGRTIKITKDHYQELRRHFGNEEGVQRPRRAVEKLAWLSYVTRWDGKESSMIVATTPHKYVNRVASSESIYRYETVDPTHWRLFSYPTIENFYEASALLGIEDKRASRELDLINAKFGPSNQVRTMILVFRSKPREAALEQEAYWQGGNKNEFVICIGVDHRTEVTWSHVFSWSDSEALKIEARNLVADQRGKRLDLEAITDWLRSNLHRFERKSFSEFDYLHTTLPFWYVLSCHLLITVIVGGWFYFAVVKPDRSSRR